MSSIRFPKAPIWRGKRRKSMNTPMYIFDKSILIKNYNLLKKKLSPCKVHYALKANACSQVLQVLNEAGASFECASVNEYRRLKEIGVDNDDIIFGLPIKTEDIIKYVYEGGGRYFVFEDMRELQKLEKLAPMSKKILRIYITDILPHNIGYGMHMEQIKKNIEEQNLLERMDGISFHISENTNIESELKALDRAEVILEQLIVREKAGAILNIGGSYRLTAPDDYYTRLQNRLKSLVKKYSVQLIAEPGLAIVDTAGSFLTRVVMTKEYELFTDVYIDGGAPNGLNKVPPEIISIEKREVGTKRIYRFIDITCLNKVLFNKRLPIVIKDDDILEFRKVGAYTLVYQNEFHLWDKTRVEIR